MAQSDVTEDDLETGPLMAIPDSLQINAAAAQLRLSSVIALCDLPEIERFSDSIQTGLLLAFERRKGELQFKRGNKKTFSGSDSFWAPYIATLPSSPSCAWLLPENELRIEIALLPSHIKEAEDCFENAKRYIQDYKDEAERAIRDYGDALGIEIDDLLWALGQVHSRAYGHDCALIPVVDLINHHPAAMPPLG